MKIIALWFRWFFSNSGALRGSRGREEVDGKTMLIYTMGNHPLVPKTCSYCKIEYWAFTKGNTYCGQFACFRRMHESK